MKLKTKQQHVVEHLLKDIANPHYIEFFLATNELSLEFVSESYCKKAETILNENFVTNISEGTFMYVSLALPDVLLNGDIATETSIERSDRHVKENYNLLVFYLKRDLKWNTVPAINNRIPKNDQIVISLSEKGVCRLNFLSDQIKKDLSQKIVYEGFTLGEKQPKEKGCIIVNLNFKKQQKTIEMDQTKKVTIAEIKKVLSEHGIGASNNCVQPKKENEEQMHAFYFSTPKFAIEAVEVLKNILPGVERNSGSGILFPAKLIEKRRFKTTKVMSKKRKLKQEALPESESPGISLNTGSSKKLFALAIEAVAKEMQAELQRKFITLSRGVKNVSIPMNLLGSSKFPVINGQLVISIKTIFELAK